MRNFKGIIVSFGLLLNSDVELLLAKQHNEYNGEMDGDYPWGQ